LLLAFKYKFNVYKICLVRQNPALLLSIFLLCLLPALSCKKTCQPGYEDPDCSVEIRAQFESLYYTATESMNGDSAYTYAATILPNPANAYQVLLTNVANSAYFANNVAATASNDTLTIAYQNPDTTAVYISGMGTISGNVLTLYYVIYVPNLAGTGLIRNQYASVWVHQ
jgi:hypothetical protein